ncbi:MAG: two-component system chemotaxis response regulator CheB [bacterium]
MSQIDVLVVDDSAVVRQTLTKILSSDPKIGKIVTASDPYVAVQKLKTFIPSVIVLDVEMPRMDGITFLQKLMSQHPLPVVICSTLTEKGSETALKALEYGAVEIIEKPKLGTKEFLEESRAIFCDVVKAASHAKVKKQGKKKDIYKIQPKLTADAVLPHRVNHSMVQTTEKVVVVGASTGGTEALSTFLQALPIDAPGVVIVQHMPEHFTKAFAKRLNEICDVNVKEACTNDTILRGHVLIAPGNQHLLVKRSGARYYVELKGGPRVSRHRPSVDVLFRSTAQYVGKNAIGVIMTGMGDDGARGMLELKESGAQNIAQDEATSVVFGMPKKAIDLGAVHQVLPLEKIARAVL